MKKNSKIKYFIISEDEMVKASIELSLKDTLESFKIDVPGVNGK
jgi:hypothetical protein